MTPPVVNASFVAPLRIAIAGLLCLWPAPPSAQAAAEGERPLRPHMVFILADDLGYADVGFMGSKEIHTPHLDRLAAGGAILDSFYVQPVCSPTRATLMTGRYPTRTGVYSVVRPHAKWGLPLEERTLADALRQAGYHTAICGKWHLGEFAQEYLPTRRGFDEQYGHFFGALDYFTKLRDGQRDWYRNDEPCADEGYSTHLLAREACRVVRERPQQKPLFLYVPFQAVHGPYQVPESYLEPYSDLTGKRQQYAGMVTAMDEAIGQIVAALEDSGIREETLIVFSSDNGGPSPGMITDNSPLRAGKATIYEGGVRVCAMANWPGRIKAGTRVAEPIHMVDWYPTLVNLAGGTLEQPLPLDGLDVWNTIAEGAKSPHEAILLCGGPTRTAVRVGQWKLLVDTDEVRAAAGSRSKKAAPRNKAAKAEKRGGARSGERIELYDLAADIGEEHNLAEDEPQRVAQLKKVLERLLDGAVEPGDPRGSQ